MRRWWQAKVVGVKGGAGSGSVQKRSKGDSKNAGEKGQAVAGRQVQW